MSGKTTLILANIVFINAVLWGQQAATSNGDQPPSLKVTVKVVNVPATVRDKHGKIINNLGKDDFLLEEDGHPLTVRYFARETDLPLTLGLL
ncbi:MAG TPA: VWA domain-containing protein, partial [Candidatus Angelobacter sp.]|nr:VWA domain-containing protein [Candidatus Angelobacter sp.]